MGWDNWLCICRKMKLELSLSLYTKINLRWIKDLKVRPETIRIPEENLGNTILATGLGKEFMTKFSKATAIKTRIDVRPNQNSFCTAKETINVSKESTYRMGENICKLYIWERSNIQHL